MQIRTRLTLQFLLIAGLIMISASIAIYFSSVSLRRNDFNKLLWNKARSTANLLSNTSSKIDADRILGFEKKSPVNLQNEKIIIVNYFNKVVYSSDDKKEIEIKEEVLSRARSGLIVTYTQSPYDVVGALFYTNYGQVVVIAAATDTEGASRQRTLMIILIVVCLISLLLLFIAGWFNSGRALKPISNVVTRVQEISITSLNLRVSEGNGTDEIGRLAKTFNNMLERLETSFAMQKDFIANASHELRTPLTSINGQLEVLMMKDRTKEDYRIALESVLEDIKSLISLSNRLLLMARASSESHVKIFNKIRVDEILWQVREEIIKHNNDFCVNIHIDESLTDADQMIVEGDENMLKVAVSNIIENGCKYSADHTVDIRFVYSDKQTEIRFEDRGIGISGEDLKKVFEPFYRGTNAISYSGSGIGLPLVSQIIKNHKGTIRIDSEINRGTIVSVVLPLVS
ncbi:MAG: HAMP domain-containing sensor histidine kinase [Bacteroidales bacterium]|jgi:signal transduction histidine kinase